MGATAFHFRLIAEKSDLDISEPTDGLTLKLTAQGRSNNDTNKEEWTYNGVKTVFEGFNFFDGSRSHAWTAHPSFLLPRILGGVRQEAPGWKKVSFKPNYFEDSAEVTYPTPQGSIKVAWKKNADGSVEESLETPPTVEVVK